VVIPLTISQFIHEAGHLVVGLRLGLHEQGILFVGIRPDEAAGSIYTERDRGSPMAVNASKAVCGAL
jgi:hypothetical protein